MVYDLLFRPHSLGQVLPGTLSERGSVGEDVISQLRSVDVPGFYEVG